MRAVVALLLLLAACTALVQLLSSGLPASSLRSSLRAGMLERLASVPCSSPAACMALVNKTKRPPTNNSVAASPSPTEQEIPSKAERKAGVAWWFSYKPDIANATARIFAAPSQPFVFQDIPGVTCYVSQISKTKRPRHGDLDDVVIASVMLGKPKRHFDQHKELRQNRVEYAKTQGYTYCEMVSTALAKRDLPDRSPEWSKLPFVRELLHRFEYVLMIDADVILANQCRSLRHIAEGMAQSEVFVSEDPQGFLKINTGVVLWRNGHFSLRLLDFLIDDKDIAHGLEHRWPFEQQALVRFEEQNKALFCFPDPRQYGETRDNSSGFNGQDETDALPWSKPGPYCRVIVHAMGPHFQQFVTPPGKRGWLYEPKRDAIWWNKGAMFVHVTGQFAPPEHKYDIMLGILTQCTSGPKKCVGKTQDARLCTAHTSDSDCHCDAQDPNPGADHVDAFGAHFVDVRKQ